MLSTSSSVILPKTFLGNFISVSIPHVCHLLLKPGCWAGWRQDLHQVNWCQHFMPCLAFGYLEFPFQLRVESQVLSEVFKALHDLANWLSDLVFSYCMPILATWAIWPLYGPLSMPNLFPPLGICTCNFLPPECCFIYLVNSLSFFRPSLISHLLNGAFSGQSW